MKSFLNPVLKQPFKHSLSLLVGLTLLLPACRQPEEVTYQLHTVKSGSLELIVPETGELGSEREVWINAPFAGTLGQLVPEGSVIKKGQTIGRLGTAKQEQERESSKLSISEGQTDLKISAVDLKRRLAEAKAQRVAAVHDAKLEALRLQQLKEERDQVALTRTRESLKSLEQRMQILELEARERTRLFGLGYLSREERDQAQLQLAEAKKEREQLTAELKVLEVGPRKQDVARQQLLVQRAKDEQRRVGETVKVQNRVGEVQKRAANARIKKYQQRFKYYDDLVKSGVLKAPVAGTLVYGKLEIGEERIPIKSGDAVQEGVQIVRLVDLQQPVVRLMVHEIDAPRIKSGQPVRLRFDAWPEKVYAGKVSRVLPVARQPEDDDRQKVRRFSCEIKLLDPDPALRPGMTAQAEIITERSATGLLVPTQALMRKGNQNFVQIISNGKAQERKVEIGSSDARMTLVRSGLTAGEQVILQPKSLESPNPDSDPTSSPTPASSGSKTGAKT